MSGYKVRVCSTRIPPNIPSMVLLKENMWENGQSLKIKFLTNEPDIQKEVMKYAEGWLPHISLKFDYVGSGDADIRISFNKDDIHNSYIGTGARQEQDQTKPTMNLGLLDLSIPDDFVKGIVLHEFGHALGCAHEHQHHKNRIKWNTDVVYSYYICKIGWKKSEVDSNIFELYDKERTHHTEVDRKSIMMYSIPKEHLESGDPIEPNNELSEIDKKFIKEQYPS